MVELGELEKQHAEFADRKVQVIAISDDDQETAAATQKDFPHLLVVSDADQQMAKAFEVIHEGAGKEGDDTNAPTNFLINGEGQVLWVGRPERFVTRYSPAEVLKAIDQVDQKSP